ncbi:MAG TPA: ribosome small subunit-dependent GTPase A [Nocardioidaceae bacterium]|nr:ribosome small subunit-dependent GTPase A [Nocardioidaceae bacterium]
MIGLDAATAKAASPWLRAADAMLGRVARVDRGVVSVLTDDGPHRVGLGGDVLGRIAADPTAAPCTGDWCVLRSWPDRRDTLERLLPRRTSVIRSTAGESSHGQVLCANVDVAALVVALQSLPTISKIERMLALAWQSGARPLVLLTKADLAADRDQIAEDVRAVAPDVEVLCISATTGLGLGRLRALLAEPATVALLGSSGHGKSTLVNALVGAEVLATRQIRADGRGRHTSVRRELVVVPGGGALIDTPGLRGVGLFDAEDGLSRAFADVDALAGRCRFSDCSHAGEPGCAVAAAIESGQLALRRFESWQRLRREQLQMTARAAARLRRRRG